MDPVAAGQLHGNGQVAGATQLIAGDYTVLRIADMNRQFCRRVSSRAVVTRVAIEDVGGNYDIFRAGDPYIVVETFPNGIARNGGSADIPEVEVELHIGQDIIRNGDVAMP